MTEQQPDLMRPRGTGPALVYRHSNGTSFSMIDLMPIGDCDEDDESLREKRICRALLQHALDLLNGENTFNA